MERGLQLLLNPCKSNWRNRLEPDHARSSGNRISRQIGKIAIKGNQHPILLDRKFPDFRITFAAKTSIVSGNCIVAG